MPIGVRCRYVSAQPLGIGVGWQLFGQLPDLRIAP